VTSVESRDFHEWIEHVRELVKLLSFPATLAMTRTVRYTAEMPALH
jgi:hypothetical protein